MDKTLASLFGLGNVSSKKVSKLKTLLSLSTSRLSILKNHRQVRRDLARGDVAQLLQQGQSDRALLQAEIVVKEENMLDAFAVIRSYCHLITERSALLLQCHKECPHELKEAISSLIYASSRSGDTPELQHVCNLFSSMFGKEFVRAATELRNSCGVNPKIVQKLSTRQPNLESRARIVKEIAAEKGITLDPNYDEDPFTTSNHIAKVSMVDQNSAKNRIQSSPIVDSAHHSSSASTVHAYNDVASAAQAACEKAEDAAAAARAAVELSRSSHPYHYRSNKGNDGPKEDGNKEVQQLDEDSKLHTASDINHVQTTSESEEEDAILSSHKNRNICEQLQSGFSSDSTEHNTKDFQFDNKSDSETEKQWGLSSEEGEGRSFKMERQFSADSTASEKKASTFFNSRYSVRKYGNNYKSSLHSESDTTGPLNSSHEDSSDTETGHVDHRKKFLTQQSKTTRRAVSVRTQQGTHK